MKVDRLVVLYEEVGDTTAEAPNTAHALDARQNQKLATAVAVDEFAKAKQKAAPLRSYVLGFSSLEVKNTKQTAKSIHNYLKTGQKDLAKLLADEGAAGSTKPSEEKVTEKEKVKVTETKKRVDEKAAGAKKRTDEKEKAAATKPLTWGAYVILHGGGGRATRVSSTPDGVANLLKAVELQASGKNWKLKKVCIVGCTLGATPLSGQSESWVKKCCDQLQVPDALVGGYIVPVYVSYKNHAQGRSYKELSEEKNWGHKLISPVDPAGEDVFNVKDVVVRMSDDARTAYKVAWRWDA